MGCPLEGCHRVTDVGTILSNRYRLLRQLGRGGMGSVWIAEHLTLKSEVAVKLIDPAIAESPEALGRFMREAQASAALRSPHVVQVLDYGVDGGVPFIAMELLHGESLGQRLERERRLSPEATARILGHVARAIGRAHEAGIVHRDLKPDNIFLVQNDDEEVAKVLDFGIAKGTPLGLATTDGLGATRTGAILGTPYYMSPEQTEGSRQIDHRTDLWSLGVIAFECLTGSRPFDGETLGGIIMAICARPIVVPSTIAVVPTGFDEWFARATARNPEERFASAKDQAHALRQVCSGHGMPLGAPPDGRMGSGRWGDSSPDMMTTGGLGVVTFTEGNQANAVTGSATRRVPLALVATLIGAPLLALGGGLAYFLLRQPPEPESITTSVASPATPPSFPLPVASPAVSAHTEPNVVQVASVIPPTVVPSAAPDAGTSSAAIGSSTAPRLPVVARPQVRPSPVTAPKPTASSTPPATTAKRRPTSIY